MNKHEHVRPSAKAGTPQLKVVKRPTLRKLLPEAAEATYKAYGDKKGDYTLMATASKLVLFGVMLAIDTHQKHTDGTLYRESPKDADGSYGVTNAPQAKSERVRIQQAAQRCYETTLKEALSIIPADAPVRNAIDLAIREGQTLITKV